MTGPTIPLPKIDDRSADLAADFDAGRSWLAHLRIDSVYQPVVRLEDREIVGYEALTRGPRDTDMESPTAIFGAAARFGLTTDVDWRARETALRGALDVGLPPTLQLFLNMEPVAMGSPVPRGARAVLDEAQALSVVLEITERHLNDDPAALLRAVAQARDRGWRIAVDDVGADTASLALLPFLRPDVIKLDMRFLHQRTTEAMASTVSAVAAESTRTGSVVLAEGVETEQHARTAAEMGATLGQGWLFGRPGPLPAFPAVHASRPPRPVAPAVTSRYANAVTPYGLDASPVGVRRASTDLLDALQTQLLRQAGAAGPSAIVLCVIPRSRPVSTELYGRITSLAEVTSLTAVFRAGPPTAGTSSLRHVEVRADEPLAREWSLLIVSPQFTAALIALDIGGDEPWAQRRFDYRLAYNRDTVIAAAHLLLNRVPSRSASPS